MATLTPTFAVLILTAAVFHAGITPIFKSHMLAQLEGCGCLALSTELLISPFVDSVSMAHLLAYEQTRGLVTLKCNFCGSDLPQASGCGEV